MTRRSHLALFLAALALSSSMLVLPLDRGAGLSANVTTMDHAVLDSPANGAFEDSLETDDQEAAMTPTDVCFATSERPRPIERLEESLVIEPDAPVPISRLA